MALVTQSPNCRRKRLFSDETELQCGKRARSSRPAAASPISPGRCATASFLSPTPHALKLQKAIELFPEMSEKVVQEVLEGCDYCIDAAVQRLSAMRLSSAETAAIEEAATASVSEAQTESARGSGCPEQAEVGADEGPSPSSLPEQWSLPLVQEMSAASDMDDARRRGVALLRAFEQQVLARPVQHSQTQQARLLAVFRDKMATVMKENSVLKKAVAIQHARMKGAEERNSEVTKLMAHYQERTRALEMTNYSLSMHLQQATNVPHLERRPPDVF